MEIDDNVLKQVLQNDSKNMQEKNKDAYRYNTQAFVDNILKGEEEVFELDKKIYKEVFDEFRGV